MPRSVLGLYHHALHLQLALAAELLLHNYTEGGGGQEPARYQPGTSTGGGSRENQGPSPARGIDGRARFGCAHVHNDIGMRAVFTVRALRAHLGQVPVRDMNTPKRQV